MKKHILLLFIIFLLFTSCGNGNTNQEQEYHDEQSEFARQDSFSSYALSSSEDDVSSPTFSDSELEQYPALSMSREDFDTLRAKIPYQGLQDYEPQKVRFSIASPFLDANNEVDMQVEQYIYWICIGEQEVMSLGKLDETHIITTALIATIPFDVTTTIYEKEDLYLELEPIISLFRRMNFSPSFWLKEHVEESARLLYGEDMEIEPTPYCCNSLIPHDDCADIGPTVRYNDCPYDESVGVYYKLPRGGGVWLYPFIFGYDDLGDQYRVEVAYYYINVGTYQNAETLEIMVNADLWEHDQNGDMVFNDDLFATLIVEYLQNESNHYYLYLEKLKDGSLLFDKQVLVP